VPCIISRPAHQRKAPTPTIGINTAISCKQKEKKNQINQVIDLQVLISQKYIYWKTLSLKGLQGFKGHIFGKYFTLNKKNLHHTMFYEILMVFFYAETATLISIFLLDVLD